MIVAGLLNTNARTTRYIFTEKIAVDQESNIQTFKGLIVLNEIVENVSDLVSKKLNSSQNITKIICLILLSLLKGP